MLSLRHATTSAFGSICLSAALLALCDLLRSIGNSIRNNRVANLVAMVFMLVFSWVITLIQEFIRAITQFATVQVPFSSDVHGSVGRDDQRASLLFPGFGITPHHP